MDQVPDRGRILIVNFEQAGVAVPPEMVGSARPCMVVQNNRLARGRLVTVIPLSTTAPNTPGKQHHKMHHLSFRDWPLEWNGQKTERWAKCDCIVTVSLGRCTDPYRKLPYDGRRYVKVKATAADLAAIDKCLLWALGINIGANDD